MSLVRAVADAPAYPGLDQVSQKLAAGLGDFLSGLMASSVTVAASAICGRQPGSSEGIAVRHVRLSPLRGTVAVAIGTGELMRLVDIYYGGEGAEAVARDRLTSAEDRFFTRIAAGLCGLLPAAWTTFAAVSAELVEDCDESFGRLVVQAFSVTLAGGPPFKIECLYPESMLGGLTGLQSLDAERGDDRGSEQGWQERLMNCALDVSFPVRAVFAEPELPVSRLMSLRPGEVIPLCLPAQIDVSVGGLSFARGTAGESNGRSAISIEHL